MRFENGSNKVAIELRVVQFWSEIILVISNRTRAACSFDFEIMHMISDQIALHSVQLPLFISSKSSTNSKTGNKDTTSAILKMSTKFLSQEGNGTRPVLCDPFAGTLTREITPEILDKWIAPKREARFQLFDFF